jgi:hypothetical protein
MFVLAGVDRIALTMAWYGSLPALDHAVAIDPEGSDSTGQTLAEKTMNKFGKTACGGSPLIRWTVGPAIIVFLVAMPLLVPQ